MTLRAQGDQHEPASPPTRERSLWKPILITTVGSSVLGFGTCFVALATSNGQTSEKLAYVAFVFFGIFALSAVVAFFYLLVRLDKKSRSK